MGKTMTRNQLNPITQHIRPEWVSPAALDRLEADVRGREYALQAQLTRLIVQLDGLSTQLERLTREHNLKVEQLETTFVNRRDELARQIEEQEQQRDRMLKRFDSRRRMVPRGRDCQM